MKFEAVHRRDASMDNSSGFIDGKILEIASPKKSLKRGVVYSGHRRKYSSKVEDVNTPDGLIQYFYGYAERL